MNYNFNTLSSKTSNHKFKQVKNSNGDPFDYSTNLPVTISNDEPSERTILNFHGYNIDELLHLFCHIKINNEIEINYKYFKTINTFIDKAIVLNYLFLIVENVLNKYETFIVHVNIEKLTLLEIERNKDFIQNMSSMLKEKFPDKLDFCLIYEGSFIFKQIYNLLSIFIDKKTLKKIRFQG